MNWARRMTCNMCNAPKYGKVEQRTGFGGGYMERDEVVEYNRREDSDDEYDEVCTQLFSVFMKNISQVDSKSNIFKF